MKVYIASKDSTLRADLKKYLAEAGLHDFTSLDIADEPHVQSSDLVIIDFEYFTTAPLTQIYQFVEALRAQKARLIFLVTTADRKIYESTALTLNFENSARLDLPLTLRRLTEALDQ